MAELFSIQYAEAATVDYFLKIDGIDGESRVKGMEGAIEIMSFSWGVSNSGMASSGSGMSSGRVTLSDINFMKNLDKASSKLFEYAATGKHISKATLTLVKTDTASKQSQQQAYYVITLIDVLISSLQQSGSTGSVPTESFSLNFAKLEVEYRSQNADGTGGTSTKASWNIQTNTHSRGHFLSLLLFSLCNLAVLL